MGDNVNMNQEIVVQVAQIVATLIVGFGAVNIINYVKNLLGWDGHRALFITAAVATLGAMAALILDGQLTPDGVTWANFGEVFTLVFVAASVRFRMLRDKNSDPS